MQIVHKIRFFFKSRFNSCQKALTTLGCIIGLPLSIILVVTGVAAIPFTGGSSLLPTYLAIALFLVIVTGSFASAGKYIGLSLDTILNQEPLTNEKIATIAGCTLGLMLSIAAIPFHFVGVRFILEKAAVAMWKLFAYFVPLTVGAFGSACSYIGRSIDTVTNQKTIFDLFKKNTAATLPKNPIPKTHVVMNKVFKKSVSMPNLNQTNSPLNVSYPKQCYLGFFSKHNQGIICYNNSFLVHIDQPHITLKV